MRRHPGKLLIGGIAAALLLALFYASGTACTISRASATAMIRADLGRRGFDPKFLGPLATDAGSCTYSAHYKGAGQNIEYAVYDDTLHGPELGTWDLNSPGHEP